MRKIITAVSWKSHKLSSYLISSSDVRKTNSELLHDYEFSQISAERVNEKSRKFSRQKLLQVMMSRAKYEYKGDQTHLIISSHVNIVFKLNFSMVEFLSRDFFFPSSSCSAVTFDDFFPSTSLFHPSYSLCLTFLGGNFTTKVHLLKFSWYFLSSPTPTNHMWERRERWRKKNFFKTLRVCSLFRLFDELKYNKKSNFLFRKC